MLFPCFMIRNAYNYSKSSLSGLFDCKKDVFYRFLSNESYDWRKILATVTLQLWNKIQEKRTSDSSEPVCLMVDDTDYPKRGIQTELIREIAECFNIEDGDIFDTLLNRSDKLSHFVEIYQLKQAS